MTKNRIESASRKRCKTFEAQNEKKFKLESLRNPELPNEIWFKIMNYLNTKDLMTNFALVCKNFKSLAREVKYLELKDVTDLEFESALNLLKTTKHLKGISIAVKARNSKLLNQLLDQALKSSKRIKSIKLLPNRYVGNGKILISNYSLESVKEIKPFCKDLEHLYLRDVNLSTKRLITEMPKFTSLKSFKMTMSSYRMEGKFTPEHIIAFANNCPNLEAVSFYVQVGIKNISHMKKAFDIFFDARHQTLKIFHVKRARHRLKEWSRRGSCLMEKIDLCKNLEEVLIRKLELQISTFEAIISLPKIRTLVLKEVETKFSSFSQPILIKITRSHYLVLTFLQN